MTEVEEEGVEVAEGLGVTEGLEVIEGVAGAGVGEVFRGVGYVEDKGCGVLRMIELLTVVIKPALSCI